MRQNPIKMKFPLAPFLASFLLAAAGSASAALDSNAVKSLELAYSRVNRFTLDNGMICLVKEDPSAPVVSIQIWVGTGSMHEQEHHGAGMSHAIEHMIFKGTPSRKPGDISKEISDAGGFINAYTSLDRTVFFADMPSDRWLTGLNVLADAVMNASFPDLEWESERQVILREMAMNRDDPDRELSRLLWETAFAVHPYRAPVIGYEDVFVGITRDDLIGFFKRHYSPDNMIVSLVGDVSASAAENAIRETFSAFKRRAGAPLALPKEPFQIAPRLARFHGSYEFARLAAAYHTVSLDHPDAPALDMLAAIVGDGRSSRLQQRIKEKKALAFSISAYSFTPAEPGIFAITAAFDPAREDELTAELLAEIEEWKNSAFSDEEVEKARRILMTSVITELQTMHGQAASFASGEFYARDPAFSTTYLKRLDKITPEAILTAAREYLRDENRTIVLLLPKGADGPKKEPPVAFVSSEANKTELSSGLVLLTREDDRLPLVSFCAAFTGGLLLENESNNGITRLMADTMTRGTERRSSSEIAEAVESRGGSLCAFSGNDSFGITARCLAQDAELFMDILADCILNPVFSDEESARQKEEQLEAISRQRESPFFIGMENLKGALFPGHPYRFSPEGTKETVEAITRNDLVAFHRKTVVAGNAVFAVFGDITTRQAERLAEKYLRELPKGMRPALECSAAAPELPKIIECKEPRNQTIVLSGFPGITHKDPRADALAVLQNAMSGLASDLLTAIRDERGLAYYSGAIQRPGLEPGIFAIYAGTEEHAVGEVLTLFDDEIARLSEQGLRDEEFERARAQIVSSHKHRLQSNSDMAMECALNELFGLGYAHAFSLEQRMNKLSPDQVMEAAASVLKPEKKAVSIVLPEGGR